MLHFLSVTIFDLTLTLNFTNHETLIHMALFHLLRSILAELVFALVISLVPATDKAKGDDFDVFDLIFYFSNVFL